MEDRFVEVAMHTVVIFISFKLFKLYWIYIKPKKLNTLMRRIREIRCNIYYDKYL